MVMPSQLSFPEFLNFWTFYKGEEHQIEGIQRLWEQIRVDLLEQDAEWVKTYRTQPEKKEQKPLSTINDSGLSLIKRWEGLRLEAYICPGGVWTIGYGHTGDVAPGDVITEEQAEDLLRKDLWRFEDAVSKMVRYPLSDNEYAALVSWTYNLGAGALGESTLLRRLNLGEQPGIVIQQEFPRWVYAGGQKLQGLVNRRNDEIALALS